MINNDESFVLFSYSRNEVFEKRYTGFFREEKKKRKYVIEEIIRKTHVSECLLIDNNNELMRKREYHWEENFVHSTINSTQRFKLQCLPTCTYFLIYNDSRFYYHLGNGSLMCHNKQTHYSHSYNYR